MRALFILLWLLWPVPALAGAWPQEKGRWFISTTVELGYGKPVQNGFEMRGPVGWSSLYLEYGLTPRLTVFGDLGRPLGTLDAGTSALLAVRWDLVPGAPLQMAVSAGLGSDRGAALTQVGFHLGKGFQSRFGGGWLNADLMLRQRAGIGPLWKLDMVVGISPDEQLRLMLGIQAELAPGADPTLRLVPALTRTVGRMDIEFGLVVRADDPEQSRFRMGIWQKF